MSFVGLPSGVCHVDIKYSVSQLAGQQTNGLTENIKVGG
jgi:hypothetical protein